MNIPDKLTVEVLDSMSLVYDQKLPAPAHQEALVLHADLIRCHKHRLQWLF